MAERYLRLYTIPQNLYADGAPVVIAAGALLKDTQTGRTLVQLKLKSITDKPVKAARVKAALFDTAGRPVMDEITIEYLDLSVSRDGEFGRDTPVRLPDASARSFVPRVTEVVFSDGSVWQGDGIPAPLPELMPLKMALGDDELVKQYRLRFSDMSREYPCAVGDLWLCSCGGINRADEAVCHHCSQSRDSQLNLDLTELADQRDQRLELERKRQEELTFEQKKATAWARAKAKVFWRNGIIAAACLAVLIGLGITAKYVSIPMWNYRKAEKTLAACDYEGAEEQFRAIGEYKDSAARAEEAREKGEKAKKAGDLLQIKAYEEAYRIYEEIGATQLIEQNKLYRAEAELQKGRTKVARELIDGLEGKNAEEILSRIEAIENGDLLPSNTAYNSLENAQKGDQVVFGVFDQDGDEKNGKEDLEWIVLEREDNRILLITKYAITRKTFGAKDWATSLVRKWLNEEFLQTAFSDWEREMIAAVNLKNTYPCPTTTDMVFLLSAEETNDYMPSLQSRRCVLAKYKDAIGIDALCTWWLRSPGKTDGSITTKVAYVSKDGELINKGTLYTTGCGIRPAVWIDLDA